METLGFLRCLERLATFNQSNRSFSITAVSLGKRNFNKFILYNRGTEAFKKKQSENPDPSLPRLTYGVRETGYKVGKRFVTVPEMIPEIIVPDMSACKFKPYVSYRVTDVVQSEFTPKNLFDAIYLKKIVLDFKNQRLDENGNSSDPNEDEKLTPEAATLNARKVGCDMFTQDKPKNKEKKSRTEEYFEEYFDKATV